MTIKSLFFSKKSRYFWVYLIASLTLIFLLPQIELSVILLLPGGPIGGLAATVEFLPPLTYLLRGQLWPSDLQTIIALVMTLLVWFAGAGLGKAIDRYELKANVVFWILLVPAWLGIGFWNFILVALSRV